MGPKTSFPPFMLFCREQLPLRPPQNLLSLPNLKQGQTESVSRHTWRRKWLVYGSALYIQLAKKNKADTDGKMSPQPLGYPYLVAQQCLLLDSHILLLPTQEDGAWCSTLHSQLLTCSQCLPGAGTALL